LSLALFGSSQSASFECEYKTSGWGTLGTVYHCYIQNSVSITSLDAAQVDSISGAHKAGYNNDNVDALSFVKGQIYYVPRGITKFFKNLIGLQFTSTGLKEIHHSDLKDFPKLLNLVLHTSNLEILEKNLFEFNPSLEWIYLDFNKISHIDPNVFNKLGKLKALYLFSNSCINMRADNPTEINNVIRTAQTQCKNSDYSNLEQQVKFLEIESIFLNSENLKEKLEELENEIKSSKFSNTFHRRLQDLKAAQTKKAQDEATTTTEAPKFETCSALGLKVEEIGANMNDLISGSKSLNKTDQKVTEMDEKISKLNKDMSTTLKDIESTNNQNFAAIMKFIENLDKKIEEKLSGIDDAQKKLMNKIHKIENESHDDKVKINQKLRAILKAV